MPLSNFPALHVSLPSEAEMPQVRHTDPLLWMETLRLRNLVARLKEIPKRQREEWFLELLGKQLGTRPSTKSLHALNSSIRGAHDMLKEMRKSVPNRFSEMFSSEGIIAFSSNYVQLLLSWDEFQSKVYEGDKLSRIREFEARRTLYLAMHLFQVRINGEPSEEADDCGCITRHLENIFFLNKLQNKVVLSWHDPQNEERIKDWCFEGEKKPAGTDGLVPKMTYLKCRSFSSGEHEHLICFDSRVKDEREESRKSLAKGIPDPRIANTDKYGLRFVFFSKDALEAGLKKLCLEVWPLPFMTWKASDNTQREVQSKGTRRNKHSSQDFKALKFITASSGFWPEVIVQRLEDYLNHKCSKGPEAHSRYRAKQLLKDVFTKVLPKEIYGVDWENEEVVKLIGQVSTSG